MTDVYETLRAAFDEPPFRLPKSEKGIEIEIVKMLYTEDDATVVAALPLFPSTFDSVAETLGREPGSVRSHLENLAARGVIHASGPADARIYRRLALFPGVIEIQLMGSGKKTGVDLRRLSKLFDEYFLSVLGPVIARDSERTTGTRSIPIEREIPAGMEVFPFEKVSEFIGQHSLIAVGECYCRTAANLLGKGCGAPTDVCLVFDSDAEHLIQAGFARKVTAEEAMEITRRAADAGLVHCTTNTKFGDFLCSCCGCCCEILAGITKMKSPHAVASSRFFPEVLDDECSRCGTCVERCHVKAMKDTGDMPEPAPDRCIGCGVCAHLCPTGAISMSERQPYAAPFEDYIDLGLRIIEDRGQGS
ncbi:MAG: 4Fe-4S binding protein [Candidatus Lindowbacteria bacterium]|nr:4Fe-4S binding protein [Candidatus Lindowbacteria bacterium]